MRQRLYIFLLFLFPCTLTGAYAQQQQGCEQITQAALQKLVPLLTANDFEQMEQVLQTIESSCGRNEFTQRLRIIGQMIRKQPTGPAIQAYLDSGLDNRLITRLNEAAEQNYQQIYSKYKADFDYVPLNHAVDSLLQIKSDALLRSDIYTLNESEESMAYLFSDHISTYLMRMQKARPVSRTERLQEVEYSKDRFGFAVHGGLYRPLNAVDPIFNNNPIFGISVISPLSHDWIFDAYFKVRLNNDDRDFEYLLDGQTEVVNSSASYMLGISGGYKFLDLGSFLSIAKAGIGYEAVGTGLRETIYWDYDDVWGNNTSTRFHTVNTLNLSAGVSAMQHLSGRTFIGAQVQYHYSPYNNDSRLLTETTSDYVSFELFFKF